MEVPTSLPSPPPHPYQLNKIWEHIHSTNQWFLSHEKNTSKNIVHSWNKRYMVSIKLKYSIVSTLTSLTALIAVLWFPIYIFVFSVEQ